jgi:hypothetical protein
MNKKLVIIAILVLALLIPTATVQAYYASVTGELRDSSTNALWAYGANIEVFNCNTLATISGIVPLAPGTSTFNINISSVAVDTPLCIEVTFLPGPSGTPGSAAKGPYPDRLANSGTLNTGTYFTGTGPLAITLRDLNATTAPTPWPLILAAVIVAAAMLALSLVLRRRAIKA